MARTIYYVGSSVDGYIADRSNKLDWLTQFNDAAGVQDSFESFMQRIGSIVMGSETYKFVLEQAPEEWPYGTTPTWVFTHHELPGIPGADITFVRGDVGIFHGDICADAGEKDVWLVGGGQLAAQYASAGLLDELILTLVPVVLGGGQPLLPVPSTTAPARLRGSRTLGDLVEMHYDLNPVAV